MALKSLEAKWKTALTSILEELDESQFKKMLSYLEKIPQGVKTGKVREEMAQIIIQYFGPEESITIINKAMDQIPRKDAAVQELLRPFVDKLKKQRQKIKEEKKIKPATGSGSEIKKEKPAVGKKNKPASDSVSVTKKKEAPAEKKIKPATGSGSEIKKEKPAVGKKNKPASDSVSVTKKKEAPAEKKIKPAPGSGSEIKKEKPAAGQQAISQTDKKRKMPKNQNGSSQPGAQTEKTVQNSAQDKNKKTDAAGPEKPGQTPTFEMDWMPTWGGEMQEWFYPGWGN